MKLRSVLLFSIVIASFAFVAIAGDLKEYELKFKGDGYFTADYEYQGKKLKYVIFSPYGGYDLLDVSHLGESKVVWELRVTPDFRFVNGTFTIAGANGSDSLVGHYSNFQLGVGTYALDWVFTGGTGRFEGASGTGHTDGLVDLVTGYAEFEFSGTVTTPQ